MNSLFCFWFVIVPVAALFMAALPSINAQTSPAPLRTYGETGESFCLGPSQIVRTDLGKMKVSDRAGNTLYEDDEDDWWNTKAGGSSRRPSGLTFAFDPVLHRWIAAAYDEYDGYSGNTSAVWISLSHTEDFLGKWTLFTFDEATVQGDEYEDLRYADYRSIKLGFGGGIVAVTVLLDDEDGRNEDFEEDDSGFVIVALGDIEGGTGDNPLTARQTVVSHDDFPYDEGCPVPARTFSSAGGLYFLSLEEEDPGIYGLSKLSFTGLNFSFSKNFSTFEVESLASDPGRVGAAQPNTTVELIHDDEWAIPNIVGYELIPDHRQIRDVMIRDGLLWAVHEGIDNGAEVVRTHWLCINMISPRFVAQSGRLGGSNGLSCISPSIAVNANRDVLIGFTATGAHTFPSAGYALRFGSDAPGTMRGIRYYVEGTASYVNEHTFYPGTTEWPGHSETQADPGDAAGLWTNQQFRAPGVTTQIVQVLGNVPPAITEHPQNHTVAPNGNASFTVGATGTNLQYQWFLEDDPAGGGLSPTINVTGVNALKVGYYKCRVSNAGGTVWSNTALLKLTTGNPGIFAFVDASGDDLTSVNWNEPSDNVLVFPPPSPYRTLTVRRRSGSDGRVRVAVNVRGRFAPPAPIATEGWDFTGIVTPAPNSRVFSGPGALIFQAGETQKTIQVRLRRETMVEPSAEMMEATLAVDPALGAATTTPKLNIALLDNDTGPTFTQAVDYNIPFTNENNRWKPQSTITSDGVDAVQTDISAPGGEPTVFSAAFTSAGTLVFRWRADGDRDDRLQLVRRIDRGTVVAAEIRGGTDWQTAAVRIDDPDRDSTGVDWQFLRGARSDNILASAFVDQIRFDSGTGGVVEFERATYSVDEGAGTVTVKINRLGHTATAGVVGVTLQNGTAAAGSDFQALNLGVLTFAAGQSSRTINFTIYPDQLTEPVETFRAVLSEQGSGSIGIGPMGTTTISIVDKPGETYATWAATKFSPAQLSNAAISGKDANPDGDSLTNVMEYAFDGDPLSALSAPQPLSMFEAVSGESILRFVLTFPRRKQSLDLTYKVQRSTDLATWQDGAILTPTGISSNVDIVQLVSATGGPIETRTVRDGLAVNDGLRSWLRLEVLCP